MLPFASTLKTQKLAHAITLNSWMKKTTSQMYTTTPDTDPTNQASFINILTSRNKEETCGHPNSTSDANLAVRMSSSQTEQWVNLNVLQMVKNGH